MFTDAIRQVAADLAHASLGVNALLASIPLTAGDATPPNVTIANAADDDWVARGVIDRAKVGNGPLLLVSAFPDAQAVLIPEGAETPVTANVMLAVRYATRSTASAPVTTQGWQTLRAAMRSIVLQRKAPTVTRRNSVAIGPLLGLTHITAFDQKDDDFLIDLLTVTLGVSDAWAAGGTSS
jgi:hypothetical protein